MNRKQPRRWIGILSAMAMTTTMLAAPPPFEITRSTIDGGGAMNSTGGGFELSGTVGQPDAGTLRGETFELNGGFWFPVPPGDCQEDGDVDSAEYAEFSLCFGGPDREYEPRCECFDVNRSRTIDLADFALIQASFTGP